MSRKIALPPFWSKHRREWIVGVRYIYEPGEEVKAIRGHSAFETEDEALAFVAKTNGTLA
jgi:hypothetical protein